MLNRWAIMNPARHLRGGKGTPHVHPLVPVPSPPVVEPLPSQPQVYNQYSLLFQGASSSDYTRAGGALKKLGFAGTECSFSFWAKALTVPTHTTTILACRNYSGDSRGFWLYHKGLYLYRTGGQDVVYFDTDPFTGQAGKWVHVVWSINFATATAVGYVNGVAKSVNGSLSQAQFFSPDPTNSIMFFSGPVDMTWNGQQGYYIESMQLDQMVMWNRALTAAQVTALYNGRESGGALQTLPLSGGWRPVPLLWYPLGEQMDLRMSLMEVAGDNVLHGVLRPTAILSDVSHAPAPSSVTEVSVGPACGGSCWQSMTTGVGGSQAEAVAALQAYGPAGIVCNNDFTMPPCTSQPYIKVENYGADWYASYCCTGY